MITRIPRLAVRNGPNPFVVLALLIQSLLPMNAAEQKPPAPKTQLATLGGGCFWCLEAFYETFNGVVAVTSGYAGGQAPNPTYEQVCSGGTGHAEVVQIEFAPAKISYETLLEIFWEMHDPTTLNRQGADVGTQYRSIILPRDEGQMQAALKSKKAAQPRFKEAITTEIVPLKKFYAAEEYHQDYFRRNPKARYCVYVINPKLEKLRTLKARIEK